MRRKSGIRGRKGLVVGAAVGLVLVLAGSVSAQPPQTTKPAETWIREGHVPIRILVQSPAETQTELQVICLFRSDPANELHGSLVEINQKLDGTLGKIRDSRLFRGELGETVLIEAPAGSVGAKEVLIIGLGDSETFSPERMELVGSIVYREASRLGVAHPFFAPTILDGGVTKFGTGEVSGRVIEGVLRAVLLEKLLKHGGFTRPAVVQDFTFLAGSSHVADTQQGIEKAIARDAERLHRE